MWTTAMLGKTYDGQVCSVARTLELVGERWTLLIVRDALLGITRFDGFLARLGIARNVLADRLNGLVDNGILDRVQYRDRPPRYEYHLTARGRELLPVIVTLTEWGDRHLAGPAGPPREFEHLDCGGHVVSQLVCQDHGPLPLDQVASRPGPGSR
jgi:DNA-binding HxlR family transcriptional regulator